MTHSFRSSAILSIGLLGIGGSAYATQPPDVVTSDASFNTAMGTNALLSAQTSGSLTAFDNTASGAYALYSNTTGNQNTATGDAALRSNTTGNTNTATGAGALISNTIGDNNTGTGYGALWSNITGDNNTASGWYALFSNTAGSYNSASGASALYFNTDGDKNSATGYFSLYSNTTGSYNTASGYQALYSNTDGIRNTASGDWGLYSNRSGNDNTAFGQGALYSNTTGSSNIGVGANAGYNVTSGSNNIEIGNRGTSGDNGTIRIGTSGTHTATHIEGISTAHVTGAAVYVTSSGQLGVLASSERYKTSITPMGASTGKLQQLRPVSFHLKSDPKGALQYGLIAEEVAKVYPELVIRDDSGKIQGVRYDELAPMLLNVVQQQRTQLQDMKGQIAELRQINESMQAAISKLQGKDERVAMR
jgi:hypothetical protein